MKNQTPQPDFVVLNQGSLFLFIPLSKTANTWLGKHCPEGQDHFYAGPNLVVEHRYVCDLVECAIADGLQPRTSKL